MAAGHPDSTLDDAAATRGPPEAMAGLTAHEHLCGFRVRHALKIALACCLCIVIPTLLQLQSIYFCPLFAFMVLSGFYTDTLGSALEALGVVLIAATGGVVLSALFGGAPPVHLVLMLAWLFAITLLLDRYPLGATVGGIIVAVLLFTSIFVSIDTVLYASVHFYGLLLLAMVIVVAVDHLVWPPHRRTVFLDVLATIYDSLAAGFARLGASPENPAELRALLRLHELAHVVQSYHGIGLNRRNPLVRLLMHSAGLLLHLEFQRREWHRAQDAAPDAMPPLAHRLLAGIGAQCRRIAQAALAQAPVAPVEPWLTESAATLVEDSHEPRAAPDTERPGRVRGWSGAPGLLMLARAILRLEEATDAYNRAVALLANPRLVYRGTRRPLVGDATTLKRSAKTVLIVVLLIVGQEWLDLPGQTMVAFYAVVFGAAANLGQAYARTTAGFAGILAGLLYAIVCIGIVAALPNFALFLGLVFFGMFCTGYLALRPGVIAIGAVQAGLVLPFATLTYDGPDWTLANAETRALALAVAGCVALLVHRLVWPRLPLRGLRRSIATALTQAGAELEALLQEPGAADQPTSARRLLPLSAVVPRALSLSNDARYLFSGMGSDSRYYHSVIQGLMSLHVHLSLLGGVIARLDPDLRQHFRTAAAPLVERLVDACATVSAQFGPTPTPVAGLDAGAATTALESADLALQARGSDANQQRLFLSTLARSLDHLAECLREISADAGRINRKARPGGES